MSPYTPRTSPLDNKSLADNLDIKKISSKGHFHEGSSFTNPRAKGLQGQLGKMYREHKFGSAKNLSRHNLKDISDLIAKEMKNAHPYSKAGLTRKMGKRIMATAWKKVKTDPTFSRSDRRDLKVVVKAIKEKSREAVLKKPDSSTKSIGAEKIEAAKNPASRLQNQKINKDNNLKISSDSLLSSILVKPLDNKKPLDRQEILMKLRRTEATIESAKKIKIINNTTQPNQLSNSTIKEPVVTISNNKSPEQTKNNNIQTPTDEPSNLTSEKNNNTAPLTDSFLNSLLTKTNSLKTTITKQQASVSTKSTEFKTLNQPQTPTTIESSKIISEPINNKSSDSAINKSSKSIKINNQALPNQSANITSIKDIENGILVRNLQNSTVNDPLITKPITDESVTPTKNINHGTVLNNLRDSVRNESLKQEPTKTNDGVTLEDDYQNTKSKTSTTSNPLKPAKIINDKTLPNQSPNITSIKDIENEILVTSLKNSATNKTTKTKPEPINADGIITPEDNNENVKPEAKSVINKPTKPTENKITQTSISNPKNPVTDGLSDTESESTEDESSKSIKKTTAEIAKEEALRKLKIKNNIASARALTRMVDERDKSNNNNGQPLPNDPKNSTGDKSAKPTTEPIISGSAKPRKKDADQTAGNQFLDVDSIDYLAELSKKFNETEEGDKPIIPQKQAGIEEIAREAEDMNI